MCCSTQQSVSTLAIFSVFCFLLSVFCFLLSVYSFISFFIPFQQTRLQEKRDPLRKNDYKYPTPSCRVKVRKPDGLDLLFIPRLCLSPIPHQVLLSLISVFTQSIHSQERLSPSRQQHPFVTCPFACFLLSLRRLSLKVPTTHPTSSCKSDHPAERGKKETHTKKGKKSGGHTKPKKPDRLHRNNERTPFL